MSDAHRLDLDDLVELSHVIEEVIGRPLSPDESSRLKAAYQAAGAVPAGTTLGALRERLQRVDLPQTAQLGHRQRIFATATRQQNIGFAGSPSSFVSVFGAATVGNIVYNTQPSPGGYVGWVCTVAGNPGTWKPFGAISN